MKTCDVNLCVNGDYWQARWVDDRGKRRGKSLGRRDQISERKARKLCRAIADEHARRPGARNAAGAMPLSAWLDEFKRLTPEYTDSTRTLYDHTASLLLKHFGEARRLDGIHRHDAGSFRAWLTTYTYTRGKKGQARTLTETTIRKHIRHCKVIFNLAVRYDHIAENPFDREVAAVPRVDKSWRYVSIDDLRRILDACPDRSWRCLFALCRLAGLRLGEAQRIAWADIDHDGRMVTVTHDGKATTKRRRRTVPMVPTLAAELLAAFDAAEDGADGPVQVGRAAIYKQADAIVKRAELQPWPKMFHTLRKNCESDWLKRYPVMDVCDWLGHDPAVASKHYHQTGEDVIADVTGRLNQEQQA